MIKIVSFYLVVLLFPLNLLSQPEMAEPDLLFTIGYEYFPKFGAEDIPGAMALEYHNGHLYLAFLDKILKIDMQGNVVWSIKQKGADNIFDIAFYKDQLVVYQPASWNNLTFYNDTIKTKAVFVHFYASNEKELTERPATYNFGAVRFIINLDDQLYFHDGYSYFPFSNFSQIEVKNHENILKRNLEVFVNKDLPKPIAGYPISECKLVKAAYGPELQKDFYNLKIIDFCNKDTIISILSKHLPFDTCSSCKIHVGEFFKNEHINKYFSVSSRSWKTDKSRELDRMVVFLDENFEIEKICHSLEYLQNNIGLSPPQIASFTYDEFGNVYYCTNSFDHSNKSNSFVKIYKIKY